MRLWSLHPKYLDRQGLTACWREALLAQAVLAGRTKGYRRHPQLDRFRSAPDPLAAIAAFLRGIQADAAARGYRFDAARIEQTGPAAQLLVTTGQLAFERAHLKAKLIMRSPELLAGLPEALDPHPLFVVGPGGIAVWERT